MPRLSAWFVRLSLLYLAMGFSLGALLLANKALQFSPSIWKLLAVHSEVLLLGWFVQLAAGVAYWILPRLSGTNPRGNQRLVWLAFWLINLGIALVIIEAFIPRSGLLLAGRLIQLAGVLAFVIGSWKRVKSFGR
jgi:heme/copper-type cytochrome/quinol oxidase subunit 1